MVSNTKFRIRKRSWEQGNYTGFPWLVDFPLGRKFSFGGWVTSTCDGTCFDTFEQARQYMALRLDHEAALHRERVISARRLVAAEAAK